MAQSPLTVTSISPVQVILLSQPPKHHISPCYPGWSRTPGLKGSTHLGLLKRWRSSRLVNLKYSSKETVIINNSVKNMA
ncbi:hypothetical protein AAY473_030290, partial [Plecturocebus cupreus]